MTHPGFKDYFSASAAEYATFRPRYPSALFDFLSSIPLQHRVAWDCATGSGQAAVPLADHFERVIATDASGEQIAHATPHPRVSYAVALADASGLADASVDLVTVAQALHWLPRDRFYAEVRRVLVPDGVLAIWCYTRSVLEGELDEIFMGYYAGTCGPYWPAERVMVDDGYASIGMPIEDVSPPPLEIEALLTLEEFAGYMRTWSATRKLAAAIGRDPVIEVKREMEPLWGGDDGRRMVRWPICLRAGRLTPIDA